MTNTSSLKDTCTWENYQSYICAPLKIPSQSDLIKYTVVVNIEIHKHATKSSKDQLLKLFP